MSFSEFEWLLLYSECVWHLNRDLQCNNTILLSGLTCAVNGCQATVYCMCVSFCLTVITDCKTVPGCCHNKKWTHTFFCHAVKMCVLYENMNRACRWMSVSQQHKAHCSTDESVWSRLKCRSGLFNYVSIYFLHSQSQWFSHLWAWT